jgi:signal transduction histidine kinase/DNA-binding response OmpR family regulator
MKAKFIKGNKRKGQRLLLSIVLVFCAMGAVVYLASRQVSREMSSAAIQNLSESLDLIQYTIEAILRSEADFQTLIAQEIARAEDPEEYIRAYEKNQAMSKMSLILTGKTEGVSNTGEPFTEEGLDFSGGGVVGGMPVSQSYVNHMGTWSYTMKCPVQRDGEEIGTLYAEYVFDAIDRSLPSGFYDKQATLYIMDAQSQRFVLKPKGMGQRSAGHLNLADFYRANSIEDPAIQAEIDRCLNNGEKALFYHDIREEHALNYMWPVNGGSFFLVGYVPVEAIQQEGHIVNQNIYFVVVFMLAAFCLCIGLYYLSRRQQNKLQREREEERRLHNQQLAEALQAAQIASQSKTTFLSNMSHDIRTPMNAVLGFASLLANEAENPGKVREYTGKIMASGQHLLSLINDILDVSKIESGKVALSYENFSLSSVLASVDAIILPMARAKGQRFHVEMTGVRHEYLVGDETRINQVLINLLSNAVKYTPEGGSIWLRVIGLKQRSSQYERLRIEVEDTGYGMTPEYLETIFDAFTRAENSTTNKIQGTGLGMAITKSIVELMGGAIEVSSQVDQGSLFRVEWELRIQEEQLDRQFWQRQGISQVLLAGGDSRSQENIQALMENTGLTLATAGDLDQALAWLRENSCQLVLADWEACGPQGVEALDEALPGGGLLALLAEAGASEAEERLKPGRIGLVSKPFFVSALRERTAELRGAPNREEPGEELLSLKGLHFLAAEDNAINAEILTELLELEGATCQVLENGRLALERFEQARPGEFDAILLDVQMPVMNGHEAARAIRALQREDAGTIPIIAMTANAFAEDEKAALAAGMDAHVSKPLDMELLKKAIRQCKNGMKDW